MRLNNPPMNPLGAPMRTAFMRALDEVETDDNLRARMEEFQETLAATIAEKDIRVHREHGG